MTTPEIKNPAILYTGDLIDSLLETVDKVEDDEIMLERGLRMGSHLSIAEVLRRVRMAS